ncbi:MAG: AbrB/MazE/SpoVT family DNA-binding domain-containing protein [Candidatus Sumerlaeia bacterium]|nr:AbrB/MazE/SpoVT family DNA-binding domain-containing protein [Candidatus Sumerlaeia bacterium]
MIKTLAKHGNSLALVIDRPILDLLKIEADTRLEVTTDGQRLIISRAEDPPARDANFRAALEKTNARYGKALKKLAE